LEYFRRKVGNSWLAHVSKYNNINDVEYRKKDENYTLACKGDTLPALGIWFHHNLAGFSNSNNDFCCFLNVITAIFDDPYTLLETD
jgi:hypothetical protein